MGIQFHRILGQREEWSRAMHLFGFKGFAKQLPFTMFGTTSLRCLLFAGLCLGDPSKLAREQVVFQNEGSPVLRRFNVTSPTQLEKTLSKALVRTPCVEGLRCAQDKLCLRPMVSISGKLLRTTSISTFPPMRPDPPSSYHSKTFRYSTLSLPKQSMQRIGIRPSRHRPSTLRTIRFRRSRTSFRTWPTSIQT